MDNIRIYAGGAEIVCCIYEAKTFWQRLSGLMFRRAKFGLLINRCSCVHTFFMRFDLDIIFLDKDYKIVKVLSAVRPFKAVFGPYGAKHILELPKGFCATEILKPEIQLKIVK